MTSGILPFALRARLRRFKIAPGDFVSLHAGVAARADQRQTLKRLCRYLSRPAIAEQRLSLTPSGNVRYHAICIQLHGNGLFRGEAAIGHWPATWYKRWYTDQ